jgi:hypothetical protein
MKGDNFPRTEVAGSIADRKLTTAPQNAVASTA